MTLPDSARVELSDSFFPSARGLNGNGDSVPATFFWSSLDTAFIVVLDSATGVSLGKQLGSGRLQARVEELRTSPQSVRVIPRVASLAATGSTRDTVFMPDSLSDSLAVQALTTTPGSQASGRLVVYSATVYPAADSTVTFVPNDSVSTNGSGIAVAQLRYVSGALPDSVVVTATMRRFDGTQVPGSPVTFVVEFRP